MKENGLSEFEKPKKKSAARKKIQASK